MKTTLKFLAVLLPAAVVLITAVAPAGASVVAHWRFEDDPGFLNDSSGNEHALSISNGPRTSNPTQKTLPGSGLRGGDFHDPLPQTGASNAKAAEFYNSKFLYAADDPDFTLTDLTVEAYFHVDYHPAAAHFLAAQWQNVGSQNSWLLSAHNSQKLRFIVSADGVADSWNDYDSTLTFVDGKDYYAAVSYDQSNTTSGLTFYLQNLTDGGPLLSETRGHYGDTPFNSNAYVSIGGYYNQGGQLLPTALADGLIDEVRISNTALWRSQLLAVPEPSTFAIWALGLACVGFCGRRRRR